MLAKRLISTLTVICFFFSDIAWALPSGGIEWLQKNETPSSLQIEIPADLATIEDVFEAAATPDPHILLHIQTAHGNDEAQQKIKKLLDYLHRTYAFKLFFVEGAAEPVNAEFLRLFPDRQRNIELAEELSKKGELTGTEAYLVDGPSDVTAIGIEDTELYRENYKAFRGVYA